MGSPLSIAPLSFPSNLTGTNAVSKNRIQILSKLIEIAWAKKISSGLTE